MWVERLEEPLSGLGGSPRRPSHLRRRPGRHHRGVLAHGGGRLGPPPDGGHPDRSQAAQGARKRGLSPQPGRRRPLYLEPPSPALPAPRSRAHRLRRARRGRLRRASSSGQQAGGRQLAALQGRSQQRTARQGRAQPHAERPRPRLRLLESSQIDEPSLSRVPSAANAQALEGRRRVNGPLHAVERPGPRGPARGPVPAHGLLPYGRAHRRGAQRHSRGPHLHLGGQRRLRRRRLGEARRGHPERGACSQTWSRRPARWPSTRSKTRWRWRRTAPKNRRLRALYAAVNALGRPGTCRFGGYGRPGLDAP